MAIKIPVSAQFDAADLKQQIQMVNDQIRVLASQVGQANKQKFEPINLRSKEDLDAFIKQMQKLLKVQTELKQTMGKTVIASFVAVCRLGLFLAPAALILAHCFGVPGVQMAQSVSDIISFIVTVPLQVHILRSLGKPRSTV